MTYRSMSKTNPDVMRHVEQNNPENKDSQSILSNQYNNSPLDYAEKNNDEKFKPGM